MMDPFSAIYGAVVGARNAMYDRGALRSRSLEHAVISIGNLRVGGTGKTPFTIALGAQLQKRKMAFDVLSRGYGRESRGVRLVDPQGEPSKYGDEPLLITRKLEVPVIVGEHRYSAGKYAETIFSGVKPAHGEWLHLLDDGFQHRQLAREYDIVLLSASDLDDKLLPSGRLREPLSALQRADAVAVPHDLSVDAAALAGRKLWRIRRQLGMPPTGLPDPAVVFCGVARPEQFFADVRGLGIRAAGEVMFADHHRYSYADVDRLLRERDSKHALGFVTTEKDAVKLAEFAKELQPMSVIELRIEIEDADQLVNEMLATVAERLRRR